MKVLVKSLISRKYLAGGGTWTADASQARDFPTSTDAVLFCTLHGLEDSELVADAAVHHQIGLHFCQNSPNEALPLND